MNEDLIEKLTQENIRAFKGQKIVYQTKPIGKEKIVLYLTTLDKKYVESNQKIIIKQTLKPVLKR